MNTGAGIHRSAVTDVAYSPLRPARPPEVRAGDGDFAGYAHDRWPRLVLTARLLTEDAWDAGELARRALVRVCARWRRIPRDDVDFHVRRSLVRAHLRGRARRAGGRRRVVLVLRYWEGLGEAEIAQVLGCSVGAVRAVLRREGKRVPAGDRRAGFAAVLAGFVPPTVPLDGILRDGALRRRRRAGAVAAGCALLLAPPAVLAAGPLGDDGSGGAPEAPDRFEPGPVRVVAPGERVAAAPGVEVWLTPDGQHWSSPRARNRFRPASDGHLGRAVAGGFLRDASVQDVSVQGEKLDDGTYFRSGVYRGLDADPARVEIRVGGRTVTANVLTLAGSPGWGVWYARTPPEDTAAGGPGTVTVYDASGAVLERSDLAPPVARPVSVGAWRP